MNAQEQQAFDAMRKALEPFATYGRPGSRDVETAAVIAALSAAKEVEQSVDANKMVQPQAQGLTPEQLWHLIGEEQQKALTEKFGNLQASEPAFKKLIGWRTADYLRETNDPKMAKNWEVHYEILPIFEGDANTKLAAAPEATK